MPDFLKTIDPRLITGIGVLLGGLFVWLLWKLLKSSIQKAAREKARFEQGEASHKKNLEANEKYKKKVDKVDDSISDVVDPDNPWDGV